MPHHGLLVAIMAAGACLQLKLEKCSREMGGTPTPPQLLPHVWRCGHYNPLSSSRRDRQEDINLACENFDCVTL
eukprot:2846090-Pyramimonas_sp.AAC.1